VRPGDVNALSNSGIALKDLGRYGEAMASWGETAVVERIDVARNDRRGALEARQSLLVAAKLGQDVSAGDQCRNGIGIDFKGP
jgi:hypothetical protein